MNATYDTKAEALKNREAGKQLMKSKRFVATCDSPVSRAGGYYVTKFYWI